MGPVLALDIGGKRTGMAVSDDTLTFAFPLETVETRLLLDAVGARIAERGIAGLVVGLPVNLKNEPTDATPIVRSWVERIRARFAGMPVFLVDERFTSSMARQSLVAAGMKKSDREKKENTDKVSAALILQSYLDQRRRFGTDAPNKT